MYIYKMGVTV